MGRLLLRRLESVATNDFVVSLGLPFDRDGDGLETPADFS